MLWKTLLSIVGGLFSVLTTHPATANEQTKQSNSTTMNIPFAYDLHVTTLPGKSSRIMVVFHGYGANYMIAEHLRALSCIDDTLVSFNFPDYDIQTRARNDVELKYGTIDEILPALYVLKKIVIDENRDVVDLYGYSAGGGALVNLLAILNTSQSDKALEKIGISQDGKEQLLKAIQKGQIILDVPLKSVEEIIAYRGSSTELELFAKNYKINNLRPIDSLNSLKGLKLNIILGFQKHDEILFNRDDQKYIKRLKEANSMGTTNVIIGDDGGHLMPHWSLWKFYCSQQKNPN